MAILVQLTFRWRYRVKTVDPLVPATYDKKNIVSRRKREGGKGKQEAQGLKPKAER
jgi:hypothetical protein